MERSDLPQKVLQEARDWRACIARTWRYWRRSVVPLSLTVIVGSHDFDFKLRLLVAVVGTCIANTAMLVVSDFVVWAVGRRVRDLDP